MGRSEDGQTVTLHRLEVSQFKFPPFPKETDRVRVGAVLDVETTGLSHAEDVVIEVGIRQFKFDRTTGEILALTGSYSAFQDPGRKLPAEIIRLTGITDEMVEGQRIDWDHVDTLLGECQIIVAHNASFDRPFIEKHSRVSAGKIWGCSARQMDWSSKGFSSKKLEILSIFHGFFTDAHRALNDADALLYLLSLTDADFDTVYFSELIHNARKSTVHVIASQSPFESKDVLKARHYRWDGKNRHWAKQVPKEEFESEIQWLEKFVYEGPFRGRHVEVQPVDQFKGSTATD